MDNDDGGSSRGVEGQAPGQDYTPSSDRGKARAGDANNSNLNRSQQSLASRIGSSASGLAQNVLGSSSSRSASGYATGALASSQANAGKDHQSSIGSSSGSSTWTETSLASSSASAPAAGSAGGFRSSSVGLQSGGEENAEQEFNDFLDYRNSEFASTGQENGHDLMNGGVSTSSAASGRAMHNESAIPPYMSATTSQPYTMHDADHIQREDGADVVALLSDPSFTTDDDPFAPLPTTDEESSFPEEQPSAEYTQLASRLDPPPTHRAPSPTNPLNLIPNFGEDSQSWLYNEPPTSEAQRNAWISHWESVLDSYTDEVWGDLLPSKREAQAELEEMKNDGPDNSDHSSTAVRRLGMLLGHLGQRRAQQQRQ
ncbi:MAG: hypothetical protein M1819_003639 [Sarea resinae]|nr:MAG: hypothetical protein M1819_003639 [Sarea resinae]